MKTITLMLAAAALTFAQAPATPAPAVKDSMNAAPVAKKHVKKHAKKAAATTVKPAAAVATPAPAGK